MLTTTVRLAVNSLPVFRDLDFKTVSIGAAYKLRDVEKALGEALKDYDERRMALIEECNGKLDKEENIYKFPKKDQDKWSKRIETLLSEELDLKCDKVPLSMVVDLPIPKGALPFMEWFIDEKK